MRIFGPAGSREKHRTGAWQFRAQAVSQKTRKKSVTKGAKKVAAASRSATKSRAGASLRDDRKASKAAVAKSSKNKRSAMPNKTAKTAAKATGSKATASKVFSKQPPGGDKAGRGQKACRKACGRCATRRGAEEGSDPAPGLQDPRVRGLSRAWCWPDPGDRRTGD